MATEEERRELQRAVAQHQRAEKAKPEEKAIAIDRSAMWSRAMKAARAGPRVRVEGE
ncbi:hypothetical protein O9X81_10620 [Agrobacterium salinitolerans]|uniref:hypothetical protein n=1 Tax=Agrobacterium salinitolerans TaxID=1183413 RepID=UPI0022B82D1A|nr:hypothetical protein [Agrobacterium salinitolerans]MCZ7857071.1 hypothetical protein [Agrobacterium salinitolerans]